MLSFVARKIRNAMMPFYFCKIGYHNYLNRTSIAKDVAPFTFCKGWLLEACIN